VCTLSSHISSDGSGIKMWPSIDERDGATTDVVEKMGAGFYGTMYIIPKATNHVI
jgi:hypothetical protein